MDCWRTVAVALFLMAGFACAGGGNEPEDIDDGHDATSSSSTASAAASTSGATSGAGGSGGGGIGAGGGDAPCEGDDCRGTLEWVQQAGGGERDYAYGVDVAADGSIYVIGTFKDEATWSPGTNAQASAIAESDDDMFVARYAADGTLLWVTDTAGFGEDNGARLGVVQSGGVVTTGWLADATPVTFGAGETHETAVASTGLEDVYVARFDEQGSLLWVQTAEGADTDRPSDIAVAPTGRSVIVGRHWGDVTFGVGEAAETTLANDGASPRLFVASYAPDGALQWATSAGGSAATIGHGVSMDADGSVVVAGSIQVGSATFGPGDPTETTLSSTGGSMFLARYASDGRLTWARVGAASTATQGAEARGTAITTSGDIVVVTSLFGDAVFGAGGANETVVSSTVSTGLVVSRHAADGELQWSRAVTDTYCWSYDVAATADDGVVLSGIFKGTATFETVALTAPGLQNDAFVARFGALGALEWVRQAGGSEPSRGDYGYGVAIAPDDGPVVIGQFAGYATFGRGEQLQTGIGAEGKHDAFVAKLAP